MRACDCSQMALQQKIAQLMISFRFGDPARADFMIDRGWGGMILSIWDYTTLIESRAMIDSFQRRSKIPLFIASDTETGMGHVTQHDVTRFPTLMGIAAAGSDDYARRVGEVIAAEAAAIGCNWSFTPVVDVNTNPDNPSSNTRTYGSDPHRVARLAQAQIRAYVESGHAGAAKHFPGQGMQGVNSHHGLEIVDTPRDEMEAVHLLSFRRAIAAGVPAIMTNHAIYSAYDSQMPATLSKPVVTDLLRGKLGFDGLILTDALIMEGIRSRYPGPEAAVLALEAGCDMLMVDEDLEETLRAVTDAVRARRIEHQEIDRRVEKVLAFKRRWGIFDWETRGRDAIDFEAHRALSREISEHAVTLVKGEEGLPLLTATDNAAVLVVEPASQDKVKFGVHIWESTLAQPLAGLGAPVRRLELSFDSTAAETDALRLAASDASAVVFLVDFRNTTGQCQPLSDAQLAAVRAAHDANPSTIAVATNPYTLRKLNFLPALLATYGGAPESDRVACEILLGRRKSLGRLPVDL